MESFLKYSGFYIIFFSYAFMLAPFLLLRKKHNLETISDTVSLPGVGKIVNFGVFSAAITQIFFAYYLVTGLSLQSPWVGVTFFMLGSISFALASFYTVSRSSKVHTWFVKQYFFFMAIGASLLSLSFYPLSNIASLLCLLDMFIMYVGTGYLYRKRKLAEAEIWTIAFSTFWAVIIYTFII